MGEEAEEALNSAGWADDSEPDPDPDYDDPMWGSDWDE